MSKRIIVIYGPTASGKSSYALHLAKSYNGVIINADSLQLFHDLSILTAVPTLEQQCGIEHKLYGILSPLDQPNAMMWRNLAIKEINSAWDRAQTPIVVGGTGLYLVALLKGLSPIPDVSLDIKMNVEKLQEMDDFYQYVIDIDPCIKDLYHPNDHKRLARALSVFMQTQKSITQYFKMPMIDPYDQYAYKIYVAPKREILYKNINDRFLHMIQNGAIDQVQAILKQGIPLSAPLFNTLGAKEIVDYLKGNLTFKDMIEKACQKSRQYAKRQYTWFNAQRI